MAATISVYCDDSNRVKIKSCEYPTVVDITPEEPRNSGRMLPPLKGFPVKYELPFVSFKTYTAMCEAGLKHVADAVINTKKRSLITPNYIWNGIMKYSDAPPPKVHHPSYQCALDKVRAELYVEEKLPILCMDASVQHIVKGTSAGLPYILKDSGMKKGDVIDKFLPIIKRFWADVEKGKSGMRIPDCAAFAKSHISDASENKVKPMWAYSVSANCLESKFSVPLTALLKKQKILPEYLYRKEMLKGGMAWIDSHARRAKLFDPGCKFIVLDYSNFDATVPAWLIRDAFSLIAEKFDFSKMQLQSGHIVEVDPIVQRRKFKKMVDYFINTPVRHSDGQRFLTNHGIPSGSMFTNIIRTLVNLIVINFLVDACLGASALFTVVFGYEGFVCVRGSVVADVAAMSDTALSIFGMVINKVKSYATIKTFNIYIQGYFNYGGIPLKNPHDLIASMLYPEFLYDNWTYCVGRALGCALASAGLSTDVFRAAQAVWLSSGIALDFAKGAEGIELIKNNSRARKFFNKVGCDDVILSDELFFNQDLLVPIFTSSKLTQNVDILKYM